MNSLLLLEEEGDPAQWSPLVLAYVGDAVFELMVRLKNASSSSKKVGDLHSETVKLVAAPGQAVLLKRIVDDLTEEEYSIVRRGKNAKIHQPPKGVKYWEYRYSTALEALLGYLYLQGREARIRELVLSEIDELDSTSQFKQVKN